MTPIPDDPRLTAYALGEMNPTERAEFELELRKSPAWQLEIEAIRNTAQSLASSLESASCPELTPAQRQAILHSAEKTSCQPEAIPVYRFSWTRFFAWTGGIAAVVICGGLWTLWKRDSALQMSSSASESPRRISNSPHALLPSPSGYSPVNGSSATVTTAGLVPLNIQLPIPAFMGTPTDIPMDEHIEKPSDKPRPPFLAPQGCVNVALNKKVTSSDPNPVSGTLDLVTDGDKESSDTSFVELHRRTQWVQIDLEASYAIYAIVVWHAHNTPQIYKDVIVQLADDADFTQNVRTVFNNDWDNSSGLGMGADKEYFENYEGKLIDAKGQVARYVRLYGKGSTFSALNRYTEVEAYGLPTTAH